MAGSLFFGKESSSAVGDVLSTGVSPTDLSGVGLVEDLDKVPVDC